MADAAVKPVKPGAPRGATKRADESGAAKAARDKLRTRERQSTFVAGQLAMRIEDKTPGRIHCIKVSTTRYKTVTTIVFDRNKRVRALGPAEDDDYDSDDGDDGDEPQGLEPKPPLAAGSPVQHSASSVKAKTASGGGKQDGQQGAWQQPRKPARQQASPPAKQAAKQVAKVDRNSLSARGGEQRSAQKEQPKALEATQLAALVNSVNQISKEVCPPSAFTIKRSVPVDGVEVQVNLAPTCLAADMARQNPEYLGSQLKDCWLHSAGATVREMLVPVELQEAKKFRHPVQQVKPRPKSPTAEPPPLLEAAAEDVQMGEHHGPQG